ncbi:hypothetical protein Cni_G12981 [Canna indica]|uniref:LRAT domain-containing protein n=1 Tax=Canna indica TaxID=4628 RepID=A0AAQ3QDB0_9LILI|nr:hypothetical protein Cni_G12981 [Canna indica]
MNNAAEGSSSSTSISRQYCGACASSLGNNQVISTCLDCFRGGNYKLRRFEYGICRREFLLRRGGTCSMLHADSDHLVVHRATYLLRNGYPTYNLFTNNCENFARYCKTGFVPKMQTPIGQVNAIRVAFIPPPITINYINWRGYLPVCQTMKITPFPSDVKAGPENLDNLLRIQVEDLVSRMSRCENKSGCIRLWS